MAQNAYSPFALALAARLGLDPRVVAAWQLAEGGPSDNPLNLGGAGNLGHYQDPVDATAAFLSSQDKAGYYRQILAARGDPSAQVAAIKASPFDASHYANGVLDRTSAQFGVGGGGSPVTAAIAAQAQQPQSGGPWPGLAEAFYDPLGSYDQGKFGGAIGGHGTHVHVSETNPSQMIRAIQLASQMGLSAGENPYTGNPPDPGVHVPDSYHYRDFPGQYGGKTLGEGLDVSGGTPALLAKYYDTVTGRASGAVSPVTAVAPYTRQPQGAVAPTAPAAPIKLPSVVLQALARLRS